MARYKPNEEIIQAQDDKNNYILETNIQNDIEDISTKHQSMRSVSTRHSGTSLNTLNFEMKRLALETEKSKQAIEKEEKVKAFGTSG